jgi:malonate transporter
VIAVAVSIVAGVLVISPVTLVLLECSSKSKEERTRSFSKLLASAVFASVRRPIILAPLLGLLFPVLGLNVPTVFANSLDLLGKATIGLALFLTGLIFSAQPLHFSPGVMTAVFAKNIAQPVLMVILIFVFQLHGDLSREALLLTALPAGFFGTVFGARYGVNSTDASSTVVLSTALSAITIPVILVLSAHLP